MGGSVIIEEEMFVKFITIFKQKLLLYLLVNV